VNEDGWHSFEVCLSNRFDEVVVRYSAKAFVVNDDVVLLCPAWLAVDRNFVIAPRAAFVDDIEVDADSLRQALLDDQLLIVVVVAATARDEESFEFRFVFGGKRPCADKGHKEGQSDASHGMNSEGRGLAGWRLKAKRTLYQSPHSQPTQLVEAAGPVPTGRRTTGF
jgi:hypothetical protein